MRHYFDSGKCATLRVSTEKENFGRIEWFSKNLRNIYGADAHWNPKGHSVSIFLPVEFR